jgi:cytochrome c oxidase assembly factor CtaG/putative copper export protein
MMLMAVGLPAAGPFVSALTTISKFMSISASMAVVGALLAMGFLLEDDHGKLSTSSLKIRLVVMWAGVIWVISAVFNILLTLANILGEPITSVFDVNTIRSFVLQITLGQYLFFQVLVGLVIVALAQRLKHVGGANLLLVVSLAAIIAPVFQSHSAANGSHALAIGSLCIHVVALSMWVGGVFALALLDPVDRVMATPRFSELALWAAIAVVGSGLVNAWTRLNFASAWHTSYALVIIIKVVLTLILIFIGYQHRRTLVRAKESAGNGAKFAQLILAEMSIMVVALALGSWLTSNQPPIPDPAQFNAALIVVGIPMPASPNITHLLFSFNPDALFIGLSIVAVALYVRGILILKRRGDSWPVGRTIAFACGIVAINYATSGGLGVYAYFAFSYHMISHMVLATIAPIGIVLSAPITLALRTLPQGRTKSERGIRGTLVAALHSPVAGFLVNPIVALLLFDGTLFILYFTSLYGGMMQSHTGHFFMDLHFLVSGFLFFHVIIGVDPNPKRVPQLARIVVLFAAMAIHAFFSVALMASTTLLDGGYFAQLHRPWRTDLLADQRLGGAIGWAMADIPILLALVATFILWMREDKRETQRIDRNTERLAAMGQPDELAMYNSYLAKLSQADQKRE